MPGSSLWLIPPTTSPFNRTLHTFITATVPYRFAGSAPSPLPTFIPHITLTSSISPGLYGTDAQFWLDNLDIPFTARPLSEKNDLTTDEDEEAVDQHQKSELLITLDGLQAEDPFFRKLTLCATQSVPSIGAQSVAQQTKDDPLWRLATACRAQGVLGGDFGRARAWAEDEYRPHLSLMYAELPTKSVESKIPAVLQDLERARAILKPKRGGEVARGATIVLVPTDQEIQHWKPIASREIKNAVWRWTSS